MQEDPAPPSEQRENGLQPENGATHPCPPPRAKDSWKDFYSDAALEAIERLRASERALEEGNKRLRESESATAESERASCQEVEDDTQPRRDPKDRLRTVVVRRRQRGHSDTEIAEDFGWTIQELLERFPIQS